MALIHKIIRKAIITPNIIGRIGEQKVATKISWNNLWGYKGKLLQNIYLPCTDGSFSELDLVYITQKGLFVIESKNYSGFIFGSEQNSKWTVTLYKGKDWLGRKKVEKHHFYNPVWQNKTHVNFLQQYIGSPVQSFSIIAFSGHCELKSISIYSKNTFVCQQSSLSYTIRKIWNEFPDTLSEEDISSIFLKLLPLTNQDDLVKKQHIENIKSKFSSTEICPHCKGTLVIRTAKRGINTGRQFYGCSNYPKCTYTKPL